MAELPYCVSLTGSYILRRARLKWWSAGTILLVSENRSRDSKFHLLKRSYCTRMNTNSDTTAKRTVTCHGRRGRRRRGRRGDAGKRAGRSDEGARSFARAPTSRHMTVAPRCVVNTRPSDCCVPQMEELVTPRFWG